MGSTRRWRGDMVGLRDDGRGRASRRRVPAPLGGALVAILLAGCTAELGEEEDTSGAASKALAQGTVFHTDGLGLNVRAAPNTASAIVTAVAEGATVDVSCQTTGESIRSNAVWSYLSSHGGYVSDAFLDTGYDGFIPGVSRCGEGDADVGGGCGDVDYAGYCEGETLVWCENATLQRVDCAGRGQSCGYQNDSVGYNCLGSAPAGPSSGGTGTCTVNGNSVPEPACGWLHHVGREVVPRLEGDRASRLTAAARVAWWSLKEGVAFLDNPIVYSNCNFPSGDSRIGPLDTCAAGRAWQVGLSGVQVPGVTVQQAEATAARLFPGLGSGEVLRATAQEAGLDASTTEAVVGSSGSLRVSWLLRNSAIGFAQQVEPVTRECINGSYSWCYGTGWDTTRLYAPDRASAMRAIDDIRALLDRVAP